MRAVILSAVILFMTSVLIISCVSRTSITGKWKMVSYSYTMPGNQNPVQMDLSDTALIAEMMRQRIPSSAEREQLIQRAQECFFEFKFDSSFRMYDIGVAIKGLPGLSLGEEVGGKWHYEQDSVIIIRTNAHNSIEPATLTYKITELSPDSMVLTALNENDWKVDSKRKIGFVRK